MEGIQPTDRVTFSHHSRHINNHNARPTPWVTKPVRPEFNTARSKQSSRFLTPARVQSSRSEIVMFGRPLFSMLIFVGMVVAVMWYFVLPALTTFKPTLP